MSFFFLIHKTAHRGFVTNIFCLKKSPPCRVQRSFEPAFAGWVSPQKLRLGRSLSRHRCRCETL
jgi:hypothetical protein